MKLPIRLSKESKTPIYHQIEEQIKAMIAGGQLSEGDSLPSIRALSKELEISVITTRRAYLDLEHQGFIKTTQGKGTFVASIDRKKKEEVKVAAVYEAIEKGVETALRHDYSVDQIEHIFKQILREAATKQKGEGGA